MMRITPPQSGHGSRSVSGVISAAGGLSCMGACTQSKTLSEDTVLPHGHWVHGFMTSCITSSIDIMAARSRVRYIPGHEILGIKNSTLAIPIGKSKLIPDQLFALDYGNSYRAFALEVDRGTEPKTTTAFRKS